MTLFVTSLYGDVMLERPAAFKQFVIPVCILSIITTSTECLLAKVADISLIVNIIRSIKEVSLLAECLHGCLERVRNACCTLRTRLGSDDYDTITCLSTIDSCRSSILKYVDALDVGGVDSVKITTRNTINYIKRCRVADSTLTTDSNAESLTWLSTIDSCRSSILEHLH